MDIEVTFPKKPKNSRRLHPNLEHYSSTKKRKGRIYFKIGKLPLKAEKGDKVFYGWDNKFWGTLKIIECREVRSSEIKQVKNWDETTGNFIISDPKTWKRLPKPISYKSGFRNFRYHKKRKRISR